MSGSMPTPDRGQRKPAGPHEREYGAPRRGAGDLGPRADRDERGARYSDSRADRDERGARYSDSRARQDERGARYSDSRARPDERGARYSDSRARQDERGARYSDSRARPDERGARYSAPRANSAYRGARNPDPRAPYGGRAPYAREPYAGAGGRGPSGPRQGGHSAPPRAQGLPPLVLAMCSLLGVMLLVGISLKIAGSLGPSQPSVIITATQTPAQQETAAPEGTAAASHESTPSPAPEQPTEPPAAWDSYLPAGGATQANASAQSVTLRSIGDVIIHQPLLDTAYDAAKDTYDFSPYFSMIAGSMGKADWSIINIEATLVKGKYGYSGHPQFSTPRSILTALKNCGVDMLTMCNNHMLDGYFDGLKQSILYAEEAGLKHVGAYATQEDFDTPEVMEIGGIKVGFMNYTQTTNSMENHSSQEAQVYGFRYIKNADYAGDIAALRAAGAEAVVVFMHWGGEYERQPESDTVREAQKLVAAGADIIVGGHPHVVQPARYVSATDSFGNTRTALVLYSMGNFISDQRLQYRDSGVIFEFTIARDAAGAIQITSPKYIPTYVWRFGDEASGYDYRVLAIGEWMAQRPSGMDDASYARMQACWYEIIAHMGENAICEVALS